MTNALGLNEIEQRQQLAAEYASYSQSRGGLSKVIGGIAGIIVILTGTLLGGGVLTAAITIGATLVWLVGKELIRKYLYQPFGEARENWEPEQRRTQQFLTLFVLGVSVLVFALYIVTGNILQPESWAYLLFVALLAPVTWRFFRTPAEASVGIFLMAACAVHSAGGAYSLLYRQEMESVILNVILMLVTWTPLLFAGVLIVQGLAEHRRFRALAAQLKG